MVDQLTQHDPRRIGPFEVLGRLGAGGMGLVYLARSASGRRVAIKTVRTELAEDQLFRVRFTREVEAARAVSGFYTAAVVDADPRAPIPWLATAYVPAPSLEEIVTECGPLPTQAVRWLAAGIAEALQSIHGAGLVHRDLKPSNVLVVEDGPRVIDFGIASGVSTTRLTMTNVAVGTPAYMSPEQAKDSRSVTGASDVFSLGSTLVYAATGHAPFHGANPVETVFMLLREGPDLAGLPKELPPLIEACMHMEAERRPTPADLQAQLAPHLFSSGGDDSGTASAWLPAGAVELIERKRGGRNRPVRRPGGPGGSGHAGSGHAGPGHAGPGHSGPGHSGPGHSGPGHSGPGHSGPGHSGPGHASGARPPGAPPAPAGQPAAVPGPPSHAPAPPPLPAPVAVGTSGAPSASVDAAPVHLPGAPAPLGAGPLRADVRRGPAPVPGAEWVRPPTGAPAVSPAPASPVPPVATPAPGRWRPWRFRMSNDVWGTPVVAEGLLYVTSFEVHALDTTTGRRRFKTRDVAWSMAVADGGVHASDGPSLFALDARDGTERWKLAVDGWVYALRAADGVVLTATRGGAVQSWSASGGERLWELTGAQSDFETPDAAPVLHGGTVYLWADGRLYALDARSGDERWTYPVGDASATGGVPIRLLPAPDGVLYVCAGTRILALDAATGTERWRFHGPDPFLSPPAFAPGAAVAGGGVYVADYRGVVYALDPATGHDRWRIPTQARTTTAPVAVADGLVHVPSGSALYTIDAVPGTGRWRFEAQGDLVGTPVAVDGRVHFGSTDQSLYTLDAVGGQLRWKLATEGEITGSPLVSGGVVYACSKDRCVYALDAEHGTRLPA
ncbi:PQQ-binding-like beta-propeller repeat protein [Streptomyces sp. JJ66]|uniref:serine/threonine-protein kinase n=1 Tax=Streptomyces sp. JJ66 TaxID=2803843 RepID=UPI001C58D5CF|nr:PQQ-binding-like beta-propeller repeat protein [Streptomyces sp. JJ66]MBW1603976.1 PQQ-binding-like beta-propeller repeat protein [Streptomyces sp. JJ66]